MLRVSHGPPVSSWSTKGQGASTPGSASRRSDIPLFLFTSQPLFLRFIPKTKTKKHITQHFSHASLSHSVFTSSPRLHRDRCSPALFFYFFPADLFFFLVVVFFFARWYHQQFVMCLRRNNGISQPASRRAEGRGEGWGVGGCFLLLRRTEEPIYLFKCAAPQERFPVPPRLRLQTVDQCVCRARSHPGKNGGQ